MLFGSPNAETQLLQASPRAGLDLPLEEVAWQAAVGATWLFFNAASYIGTRLATSPELVADIAGLTPLLGEAAR